MLGGVKTKPLAEKYPGDLSSDAGLPVKPPRGNNISRNSLRKGLQNRDIKEIAKDPD